MWVWFVRWISGFAIFGGQKGERIGKILFVSVIAGFVFYFFWVTVIKPHINPVPTTRVESGGNYCHYEIKVGFGGCARMPNQSPRIIKPVVQSKTVAPAK